MQRSTTDCGSRRKYIVGIFAGGHYDGMGSPLQKLLMSLDEASKYSNSMPSNKICIFECVFLIDLKSNGENKALLLKYLQTLDICKKFDFISYSGRTPIPVKPMLSQGAVELERWKRTMILRLKDLYCYCVTHFWEKYEIDYILNNDGIAPPEVLFLEDDIQVAPDLFNMLGFLIDQKNNKDQSNNLFRGTIDVASLASWGSENSVNAGVTTSVVKRLRDFPTLAYSYNFSFFQKRIRPVLRKVRRNKVDIEWNNALFKALYSEDAFLCIQPTLSRVHHAGYNSLLGNNHKRPFHMTTAWPDGNLAGLNLLDYEVEPFLRNAIGIPCPDVRNSVLQMISKLDSFAASRLKQVCSNAKPRETDTRVADKCKMLTRRSVLSPKASIPPCSRLYDFLFPRRHRFGIVPWSQVVNFVRDT